MFYDFVVSGGGLAGSLAALALKKLGFSYKDALLPLLACLSIGLCNT